MTACRWQDRDENSHWLVLKTKFFMDVLQRPQGLWTQATITTLLPFSLRFYCIYTVFLDKCAWLNIYDHFKVWALLQLSQA